MKLSAFLLSIASITSAIAAPAFAIFPPNQVVVQDWHFNEAANTILENTSNSVAGGSSFHASPADSATTGSGAFRIQRPPGTTLFGSAPLEMPATGGKMWIVADIAEWNLTSDVSDFRIGFGNQAGDPESTASGYMLAEFSLRRIGLGGLTGGSMIIPRSNPGEVFGPTQTTPLRVVLQYDRDNQTCEVFFSFDNVTYTSVGSAPTSAALAPNYVRFMALNSFAQTGAFLDVDRVFVAYAPPAGNISLVGHADPFSQAYGDVGGEGNLAVIGTFLNNNTNGVGIFDISNPENPILTAEYNPGGTRFQDVWVRDGLGYFGCWRVTPTVGNNGVHIVSLANPFNPVRVAQITPAMGGHGQVHTLFLDGDYLYTASHRQNAEGRRVKVFNISNPLSPQFVRSIQTTDPERIHQITVRNGRLFTSGWGGHTDIFDISNVASSAPLLGTILSGTNSHSSWPTENGNVLVSAREISGGDLRFFDISDPANPELILRLTPAMVGIGNHIPHNPVIVGNLLFVSWYENGLQVFDIANPAEPVRVGYFDTGGFGASWDGNWGVNPLLGLNRVLLSDMSTGFFIVDATAVLTATGNYPPLLARLPQNVEKAEGSDVEFSVLATGSAPLSYQWHRNGEPIPGATDAVLNLTEIALADGGNFTVTVANAAGEITSPAATLSVISSGDAVPPQINAHPAGQTAATGGLVTFVVTASGTQQLRYQWHFNGAAIPGAEESVLSVGPVMLTDAGSYSVRVWNSAGEAWSLPAVLEVEDPGFIYAVRISAGVDGAVVSWRTRDPATGYVEYGEGHHHHELAAAGKPALIQPLHAEFDYATPATLEPATAHTAYLGGLHPETDYSYSVIAFGNGIRHDSPEFLFTTPADDKGGSEGLPQWWVEHYFDGPVPADFDADGDGWSLEAEYLAGTSPVDPASRPRISIVGVEPGYAIAFWPVHPGRSYRLETTESLLDPWVTATAVEQDENGARTFQVNTGSAGAGFFRVVIARE
jgi:hypothetical protein